MVGYVLTPIGSTNDLQHCFPLQQLHMLRLLTDVKFVMQLLPSHLPSFVWNGLKLTPSFFLRLLQFVSCLLLHLPGWRNDLEMMISSFDIILETDHEIASFQQFANLLSWANVLHLALKLVLEKNWHIIQMLLVLVKLLFGVGFHSQHFTEVWHEATMDMTQRMFWALGWD